MRFVIYKNSILATICSMFGAVCIVMAVSGLSGKEIEILPGIGMIAVGLGLMFLAGYISDRKAKKQRDKARVSANKAAASNPGYTQPRQTAQTDHPSAHPTQTAAAYSFVAPAAQVKPVKKSSMFAGTFFLIAALLELLSICIPYTWIGQPFMVNSDEVALVAMGLLLAIAAFRSKHIQQVSILFVIGFLGLALASVDVALVANRAYGSDSYITGEGIYYAVVTAPAMKAAAYLLMGILALLSTRKLREYCGGIIRWFWFVPLLPLLLAYSKEIADDETLWRMIQTISRHGGWPGLKNLVRPAFLNAYAIVFLTLAVFFSGICFRRLCKKPEVSYRQAGYVQPEPQSVYSAPVQETPVQPQREPQYTVPEPPKAAAPKRNDQEIEKQLQAYKDLLDCGILTQEEYDQKVRELMRG